MYEGLKLATEMGFTHIDINLDAQQVVQDNSTNNTSNIWGRKLIPKIIYYLLQNREIRVTHVYREANLCADTLARKGLSLPLESCIFHFCPSFVYHLLEDGLSGVPTPWLVPV